MDFPDGLRERRQVVLDRWRDLILGSYPEDATGFMRREKDRFNNPVGHIITEATEALYDGILAGRPATEMTEDLDRLVRLRAVQDFSPAEAVSFVFLLKRAIREELGTPPREGDPGQGMDSLDQALDELALAAFNVYMRCREAIFELRASEMKRQTSRLLALAERLQGPREDGMEANADDGHVKGGCGA